MQLLLIIISSPFPRRKLKSCSRCLSASSMAIPRRRCETFVLLLLLLSSILLAAAADEDDVRCLKGVRDSLSSPTGKLNWNFSNTTAGFVCSFAGVSCWNPQENRVIDPSLPSMSLSGTIPSALQYCHTVTSLDLSSNSLTGPIPSNLCDWLPYLVTLDLSHPTLSPASYPPTSPTATTSTTSTSPPMASPAPSPPRSPSSPTSASSISPATASPAPSPPSSPASTHPPSLIPPFAANPSPAAAAAFPAPASSSSSSPASQAPLPRWSLSGRSGVSASPACLGQEEEGRWQ